MGWRALVPFCSSNYSLGENLLTDLSLLPDKPLAPGSRTGIPLLSRPVHARWAKGSRNALLLPPRRDYACPRAGSLPAPRGESPSVRPRPSQLVGPQPRSPEGREGMRRKAPE